jgi:hypothetical protein
MKWQCLSTYDCPPAFGDKAFYNGGGYLESQAETRAARTHRNERSRLQTPAALVKLLGGFGQRLLHHALDEIPNDGQLEFFTAVRLVHQENPSREDG